MKTLGRTIRSAAHPIAQVQRNYDSILDLINDAPIVLLGAQTHGTHEFYRVRAEITQRLIEERGFNLVAVEADWPDAYRVNRYIRGIGSDPDATSALSGFETFPSWLWRNADVLDFVGWLKTFNDEIANDTLKVGFYGIDLYSLRRSIRGVVTFLEQADPAAAEEARRCYDCFNHSPHQRGRYGFMAGLGLRKSCEDAAMHESILLSHRHTELMRNDGPHIEQDLFSAEQNALLVQDAERFYRTMFQDRTSAWNQRDAHMARVVQLLLEHFRKQHPLSKIVVWAHNSHIGDERAKEHDEAGRINMGQLIRERYGQDALLIGLTTYHGTVTAAPDWWNSPAEQMPLPPPIPGSHEDLLHRCGQPEFLLDLRKHPLERLAEPRLQRSVGVVYRPSSEEQDCYSKFNLLNQFDAIIHLDYTRAVEPLEPFAAWDEAEAPETFPMGV